MKKHILFADDEEETRKSFTTMLEMTGYQVTGAANGKEALDKIVASLESDAKVDLLITDIRMEGMSGIELMDELAKRKISVPTLAITGYGDKQLIVELMRRGCLEYIDKPFEATELLDRVAAILEKP